MKNNVLKKALLFLGMSGAITAQAQDLHIEESRFLSAPYYEPASQQKHTSQAFYGRFSLKDFEASLNKNKDKPNEPVLWLCRLHGTNNYVALTKIDTVFSTPAEKPTKNDETYHFGRVMLENTTVTPKHVTEFRKAAARDVDSYADIIKLMQSYEINAFDAPGFYIPFKIGEVKAKPSAKDIFWANAMFDGVDVVDMKRRANTPVSKNQYGVQ